MKKRKVFFCFFNIKKLCLLGFVIIFICACVISTTIVASQYKKYEYTIVIDAGHGGIDGGCVGVSGINESVLNLKYAKTLKRYFSEYGFNVILTRETDSGLYGTFATNKKKDDMKKRKHIIDNSGANLVVSIHMNSYTTSSSRGAQAFYNKDSEQSKILAQNIQNEFLRTLIKPRKSCLPGDYYIVSCSNIPSVLIECGFISNPEEEQLLLSNEYCEKLCYSILCGVIVSF